ncbi:hypothetical protein FQA39_LY05285 [Lamprigera yunnana]|nr:hypothetical protein FQA39_LY05285 [Lamprigera yunnana]
MNDNSVVSSVFDDSDIGPNFFHETSSDEYDKNTSDASDIEDNIAEPVEMGDFRAVLDTFQDKRRTDFADFRPLFEGKHPTVPVGFGNLDFWEYDLFWCQDLIPSWRPSDFGCKCMVYCISSKVGISLMHPTLHESELDAVRRVEHIHPFV